MATEILEIKDVQRKIKDMLDTNLSKLTDSISPSLSTFATSMFAEGLIPSGVKDSPDSVNKVINSLKSKIDYVTNITDLNKILNTFLDIVGDLKGSSADAAKSLKAEIKKIIPDIPSTTTTLSQNTSELDDYSQADGVPALQNNDSVWGMGQVTETRKSDRVPDSQNQIVVGISNPDKAPLSKQTEMTSLNHKNDTQRDRSQPFSGMPPPLAPSQETIQPTKNKNNSKPQYYSNNGNNYSNNGAHGISHNVSAEMKELLDLYKSENREQKVTIEMLMKENYDKISSDRKLLDKEKEKFCEKVEEVNKLEQDLAVERKRLSLKDIELSHREFNAGQLYLKAEIRQYELQNEEKSFRNERMQEKDEALKEMGIVMRNRLKLNAERKIFCKKKKVNDEEKEKCEAMKVELDEIKDDLRHNQYQQQSGFFLFIPILLVFIYYYYNYYIQSYS